CLVALCFSHNPSIYDDFIGGRGHDSLYGQERTKKSRDNKKLKEAASNNSNTSNNTNASNNNN
ncbi:unnamed protein product, partial [Rotaria sordida]